MEKWSSLLESKKREDEKYLFELQKLLDIINNLEDSDIKERIIYQISKCNKRLNELIDEIIEK